MYVKSVYVYVCVCVCVCVCMCVCVGSFVLSSIASEGNLSHVERFTSRG